MNRDVPREAMQVQPVELSPLGEVVTQESAAPTQRLAALSGVRTTVTVTAGTATTSVGEVLNLKEGQVLTMDTALNAPFDIVLNGTVIARGDLVAVGEHFGVRITQVQLGNGK